ncbi:hypothetical protein Bca4012_044749 [Brassica carinata]
MFFRSGSDFGKPMGSLLGRSLPNDFPEVFLMTSRKSSDGVFFHIKWSLSLSLCIKSFKLVVHGGWCIDGNDNIVNT